MGTSDNKLSAAGWVAIVVLVALLVAAIWYAAQVWISMSGVHMSLWGWTFLILGVVVTTGLGAGLMALVFYSSRHDMDQ
jgi:ABC-type multidrug transport system permease subunit